MNNCNKCKQEIIKDDYRYDIFNSNYYFKSSVGLCFECWFKLKFKSDAPVIVSEQRRDQFICAALTGICANPAWLEYSYFLASDHAIKQADSVLAVLNIEKSERIKKSLKALNEITPEQVKQAMDEAMAEAEGKCDD